MLKRILLLLLAPIVPAAAVLAYGLWVEPRWTEVVSITIPIRGLGAGFHDFRIVQLSDLHLYPFTPIEQVRHAIETTNALEPDLVVLTGDYVTTSGPVSGVDDAMRDIAPLLLSLDARHGVVAVMGNHDGAFGRWRHVIDGFRAMGIPLLLDEATTVEIEGDELCVAGLRDALGGHLDLDAAIASCPAGAPVIALLHEPDPADAIAATRKVALQLSGHSHGGQVRIPFFGAPLLPPGARRYDQGLYPIESMWLYVNRGIGVIGPPWGPPIRINSRPEITEITLVPG